MIILGIETSCDETAAAVVRDGNILSNIVASQISVHRPFGGVVPELASRHHIRNLPYIVDSALSEANVAPGNIYGIAVTNRPGLIGSLLVGLAFAKGMAALYGKKIIGINHLEAHFTIAFALFDIPLPAIALVVSGGHTTLYFVRKPLDFKKLGETRDDAAGEAFDKVAKLLGLSYPGGVVIDRLSKEGEPDKFSFPRGMIKSGNYDFSFSGLKTAVAVHIKKHGVTESELPHLVASFQEAVVDVLVEKSFAAANDYGAKSIIVAGGVAANSRLREKMLKRGEKENISVFFPPIEYCTDNAAMVAYTGYLYFLTGKEDNLFLDASDTDE